MTTLVASTAALKVGDAVWVAVALLHQRNPKRTSFPVAEIVDEVKARGLTDREENSVYVHANQHCVANRPPNPAKLRMLVETADGERRLFCEGDRFDQHRDGRVTPKGSALPEEYRSLLDWYSEWSAARKGSAKRFDALLALRGSGRELWADEHADEYIDNLRREDV